jgi:hypothetical protein
MLIARSLLLLDEELLSHPRGTSPPALTLISSLLKLSERAPSQSLLSFLHPPPVFQFQLVPLPSTNPILLGNRWKEYHVSLGPTLENLPGKSWDIVQEEKDTDAMVRVSSSQFDMRRNLDLSG